MIAQCGNYHEEVSWRVMKSCGSATDEVISSTWGGQALWRKGDIDMTRRLDMEEEGMEHAKGSYREENTAGHIKAGVCEELWGIKDLSSSLLLILLNGTVRLSSRTTAAS